MPSTAVTAGESSANEVFLQVLVLTGATEAGGRNAQWLGATASITPAGSNSFIAWVQENFTSATVPSAAASNTVYAGNAGSEAEAFAAGYYSGTVTGGSAVTIGSGTSCMSAGYEILSAGGSTPAIDASTPSFVLPFRTHTATTGSFTPPANSVLVALLGAYDTAATISPACSDTLGLTWTQRAIENAFSEGLAVVWTATVTSAAATARRLVVSQAVKRSAFF